jgi:hypothetical protein
MNNDQLSKCDDQWIDQLVDGELSGDSRRQLLVALDSHPDGWRRCALAFVEAQTWRSEMRRIVEPVAKDQPGRLVSATVESAAVEHSNGCPSRQTRVSPLGGGTWLAIAAALLIAFGLGQHLGTGERASLSETQIAGANQSPAPVASVQKASEQQQAGGGDAVTLVVNDHRGVPHRLSVPLVEGRRLGEEFSDVPNWSSPELVRQLDERGLSLVARRRYAPMYFEQQNQRIPLIVPVDDAIITPANRRVF